MRLLSAERRPDRTLSILLVIAALALVARLLFLGERIAHWDEGRVAYDILRYMATGTWEYRPIVHGPFLVHVNSVVFALLGPTDFASRLAVAVIGGLFPLAAWLYRDHLGRVELLALGFFLAADPILLYYSRFMRNDVPVAAFAFVAVGFYLRLHATGDPRYLYAGTASWALAFTAKENALLYVVAILGGLLLLLDHRLFLARERGVAWTGLVQGYLRDVGGWLWRYRIPVVVAAVEFLVIILFFYTPRVGEAVDVDVGLIFTRPLLLLYLLDAGTIGAAGKIVGSWLSGAHQDHPYLPFLGSYLKDLGYASASLALLAVLGFVTDRYGGDRPRDIVALGFYWGIASVVGYPIAVDIKSAWSVAHAIVPLAIPAAAAVGLIYRWGTDALADRDHLSVALAAVVLLLFAGQIVWVGVSTSYLNPQSQDNELVQYAQPEGEMRPVLRAIKVAAAENEGVDVLWYGTHFDLPDESATYRPPVPGGEWYNRLPLPWYLEAFNATVESTDGSVALEQAVRSDRPPVIITCKGPGECPSESELSDLERQLGGYRQFRYEGRLFNMEFVFFVDEEYAPSAPGGT